MSADQRLARAVRASQRKKESRKKFLARWKASHGTTKKVTFKCKKGTKGCVKGKRTVTVRVKGNKYKTAADMVKGMHKAGTRMGIIISAYRMRKGAGKTLASKFKSMSKEKAEAAVKKILGQKKAAKAVTAKVNKEVKKAAKASNPTAAIKKATKKTATKKTASSGCQYPAKFLRKDNKLKKNMRKQALAWKKANC